MKVRIFYEILNGIAESRSGLPERIKCFKVRFRNALN